LYTLYARRAASRGPWDFPAKQEVFAPRVSAFDSALRLNLHPHTLAIDGVYVQDGHRDELVFHALPEPTGAEVTQLAGRIAERAENVMRKHGRWVDADSADTEPDGLSLEQPALSACYQASAQGVDMLSSRAGRPTLRLVTAAPALKTYAQPGAAAVVRGFGLGWRLEAAGFRRRLYA
jgi:hypothetical protein